MKKLLVVLCLVIVQIVPLFSQETTKVSPEKNVLKVNTLSLILGTGSIFYERKLAEGASAQAGAAYLSYKFGDTKFTGLVLTPEVRIYPKKNAIDGFYLAPYLRYQNFTLKNKVTDSNGSLTSLGGGVMVGRQWITNSGFTMDLFFGAHYSGASIKVDSGTDSFDADNFSGFKPRVGFALGFAF